jgi:hypothetical protein
MKSSSMRFAVCVAPAVGLLVAAVAAGQRAAEPQVQNGAVPAVGAARNSAVTQGFSEMVTVSKEGDAVWLYSLQTGRWHKQAIPADQGPISPIVGFGVVAFRTRTMLFACSSQTGAWDSVEIGDLPGKPTVGRNLAACRAGNKLYGFSSETGGWDSADLGEGVVGHPTVGTFAVLETGSKVYAFSVKTGNWAGVDRDKP